MLKYWFAIISERGVDEAWNLALGAPSRVLVDNTTKPGLSILW